MSYISSSYISFGCDNMISCSPELEDDAYRAVTHRSSLTAHCSPLFRRQRQPEYRNHSLPRDIHLRLPRSRQVKRFAILAAIHFGMRSPGLLDIAALALDGVLRVRPKLQVTAAEFPFGVFLVAGALSRLLDLHFVVGKLRNVACIGSHCFASRQRTYPSLARPDAAGFGLTRPL